MKMKQETLHFLTEHSLRVARNDNRRDQNAPSRSIVSLILLAAFSLRSPGWLLLMENKVMTPEEEKKYFVISLSSCYKSATGLHYVTHPV